MNRIFVAIILQLLGLVASVISLQYVSADGFMIFVFLGILFFIPSVAIVLYDVFKSKSTA